jgi:hypothetical protein
VRAQPDYAPSQDCTRRGRSRLHARRVLALLLTLDVLVAPAGVVPPGARLVARVNTSIGTANSLGVDRIADETKAGAPFAATVETRVVDERGQTRLQPGAILHGHVAKVARGEGVRRAQIEVAIDRLGQQAIDARVVALDVQQLPGSDPGAPVDATSFWGALMGGVAFGIPGVAIGHGFGGSLGAVNAVRARQVEGWVEAGSLITVELAAPLPICAAVC